MVLSSSSGGSGWFLKCVLGGSGVVLGSSNGGLGWF